MATATLPIMIQVDPQTAEAYYAIPAGRQALLQQLIALLLQEFTASTPQTLLSLMNDMSQEAAANGLDEATLTQLLQDE